MGKWNINDEIQYHEEVIKALKAERDYKVRRSWKINPKTKVKPSKKIYHRPSMKWQKQTERA